MRLNFDLKMAESTNNFKTPSHKSLVSRLSILTTPDTVSSMAHKLMIPASPAMKRLGFGTGVNVFLLERFSPNRGRYGSPWAIKKINSNLRKRANVEESEYSSSKAQKTGGGVVVRRQTVAEMCNTRLEKEAKLLQSFSHPNIIGFRGYTTAIDGSKCLMMESGERDLNSLLEEMCDRDDPPLPAEYITKVCIDMSSALQYLHNTMKLLHGDLKSANVLIKGDFKQIKLCDFGVCLKLNDKLTALPNQCYIGTECWSPPEVMLGDALPTDKTDIFAFGLTIWECLSLSIPHVHVLNSEPGEDLLSEAEQYKKADEKEQLLQQLLGTRPGLPENSKDLGPKYQGVLECFHLCTFKHPADRLSANDISAFFADLLNTGEEKYTADSSVDATNTTIDIADSTDDDSCCIYESPSKASDPVKKGPQKLFDEPDLDDCLENEPNVLKERNFSRK